MVDYFVERRGDKKGLLIICVDEVNKSVPYCLCMMRKGL
jgi:hypothetical protein